MELSILDDGREHFHATCWGLALDFDLNRLLRVSGGILWIQERRTRNLLPDDAWVIVDAGR